MNLFVLYNPYYNAKVIDEHLEILRQKGQVAFGKIKSKLSHINQNPHPSNVDFSAISDANPMQLFLSDYANLFVAKVIQVSNSCEWAEFAPAYYKNFEVEFWFVIADMRALVRSDFESVRDVFLANFTTPDYGGHHYAVYGNSYRYPLLVKMKDEINYFQEEDVLHYMQIHKDSEFVEIYGVLQNYVFGCKNIRHFHPDSLEYIISAEMEFAKARGDSLYDFTGVMMKYAKAIELEAYLFFRRLFLELGKFDGSLLELEFQMQGHSYKIAQITESRFNLGIYRYLCKLPEVMQALHQSGNADLVKNVDILLSPIQKLRNSIAHESRATLEDINKIREKILGIGNMSVILEFVKKRQKIGDTSNKKG